MEHLLHKAILYQQSTDVNYKDAVLCKLCSHYCRISQGKEGTCLTRINLNGELYTKTYNQVQSYGIDPIEKKPFFHFKPRSSVLSFGAPGCNFRCLNCQNYSLSQFYNLTNKQSKIQGYSPEELVQIAVQLGCDGISYTYSEPTIFFELARDVILESRRIRGGKELYHVFVSNGYLSIEALDLIEKENLISGINIDLKFIDDSSYKRVCSAKMRPVMNTIKRVNELREIMHLEVINLLIPGENDSIDSITKLCEFMASVSPDIPLHFNRFHPTYKMDGLHSTEPETMLMARKIAHSIGIKHVYLGNISLPDGENTFCPKCKRLLVGRSHFDVGKIAIKPGRSGSECSFCGEPINFVL
ncbi:MAG: AmmeMemoRadiSam system radical enzyme [Ignavibacteria bacterium]|nr:AmmeMemoRadiSam system radical enzyme [Ignavibacteria bacterium]